MGYTGITKRIISTVIKTYQPKSVIDLGSQQDYDQPNLPAPFVRDWYENQGIKYTSIDLNGEGGALDLDLSKLINWGDLTKTGIIDQFGWDLVVDAGTSEHVCDNGTFSIEAIYNCWVNKHNMLRVNGAMISENPKSGNWPGHGFNYYTKDFYRNLEKFSDYHIILLDEIPAMENRVDGWNVLSFMVKRSEKFPTLTEFAELGIKLS